MNYQVTRWSISMSSLVILAASVFKTSCRKIEKQTNAGKNPTRDCHRRGQQTLHVVDTLRTLFSMLTISLLVNISWNSLCTTWVSRTRLLWHIDIVIQEWAAARHIDRRLAAHSTGKILSLYRSIVVMKVQQLADSVNSPATSALLLRPRVGLLRAAAAEG